ncbi:MAG TPA: GtrA family protein, partial [Candidatus Thermoplasmatota archaeon]|nr:GtrA family protein [Candidatus Thermoplasmatota archaeon]
MTAPAALGTASRFARFAAVGLSGVAVNATALFLLVELAGWHYAAAAPLSIELSILSNYALNRRFTWQDRPGGLRALALFHGVCAAGAAIQYATLLVLAGAAGWHYQLATLAGVAAATAWNFLANDRVSFRAGPLPGAVLYAGAAALMLAVALVWQHPWDTYVFRAGAETLLHEGVTPYETAASRPPHLERGDFLPPQQQGYAYPPLPMLLQAAAVAPFLSFGPGVTDVAVRLPAIAGILAFAGLGAAYLRDQGAVPGAVRRFETAVLLNPLAIVVASVWGQAEAMVLPLLALALLLSGRGRPVAAGVAAAAAVLCKPWALLAAPFLLLHMARTGQSRQAWRLLVAGAATATAACLPFLLHQPEAFLHQVVGMHVDRPPSRFSLAAAVLNSAWEPLEAALHPAAHARWVRTLALASSGLAAFALAAALHFQWRQPPSPRTMIAAAALGSGAAMAFGKVLNEQYLLLPAGLVALAAFHPADGWAFRRPRLLVWGPASLFAAAGMLDGFHLLTFLRPHWQDLLPHGSAESFVAGALGWQRDGWRLGLDIAAGTLAAAALAIALLEFVPAVRTRRLPAAAPLAVLALLLLPALAAALPLTQEPLAGAAALAPEDPRALPAAAAWVDGAALAWVRTDWHNPGSDPDRPHGPWR